MIQQVAEYRILNELGQGGFATVHPVSDCLDTTRDHEILDRERPETARNARKAQPFRGLRALSRRSRSKRHLHTWS